jgi:hypothetical protein
MAAQLHPRLSASASLTPSRPTTTVWRSIWSNFKYFVDDSYLEVVEAPFSTGGIVQGEKLILNTRYKFCYNHESPGHAGLYISQGWAGGINHYVDNNFALLKDRYNKRIQAFRNYIHQGQNGSEVTFIVFRYSKNIQILEEALAEVYPNLNYKIIVQSPPDTVELVHLHYALMKVEDEVIGKELDSDNL